MHTCNTHAAPAFLLARRAALSIVLAALSLPPPRCCPAAGAERPVTDWSSCEPHEFKYKPRLGDAVLFYRCDRVRLAFQEGAFAGAAASACMRAVCLVTLTAMAGAAAAAAAVPLCRACSLDPDLTINPRSLHGGCSVERGEKWGEHAGLCCSARSNA